MEPMALRLQSKILRFDVKYRSITISYKILNFQGQMGYAGRFHLVTGI